MLSKKEKLSSAELLQIKEVADGFNKLNKKLQLAFIDKIIASCKLSISMN